MKKPRTSSTATPSTATPSTATPSAPSDAPEQALADEPSVPTFNYTTVALVMLPVSAGLAVLGVYQLRAIVRDSFLQVFELMFGVVPLLISIGLVLVAITLLRAGKAGDPERIARLFERMRGSLKIWQHAVMAVLAASLVISVLYPKGISISGWLG